MKKLALILLLCLAGTSAAMANPPAFGVSFGVFYSSLSPYGEWISVGADLYGWRPLHIDAGWQPYTNGRWVWTDDGWYWASDEPWGWAAYHYGRWYFDDYYGWIWIPGYDWAPAWVEWRYGGDYIGWAPLSPYAVFSVSFGIHYRNHWVTPHHWWSFTDCHHFGDHDLRRYVYRHDDNDRYIGRTRDFGSVRYDGGRVVSRGPDRGEIERRGSVRISRADIVDVSDRQGERIVRGNDNRMRVETYRPRISASDARSEAVRPPSVRQTDRPVSMDTRGLDARAREEDIARGRDIRRSEQYRQQRQMETQQYQSRPVEPSARNYESRRSERNIERTPAPDRPYMDQQPAPRVQQHDQLRSREPERLMRRPESSRPEYSRPEYSRPEYNRAAPSTRVAPQSEARRYEGGGHGSSGTRGGGGQSSGGGRGGSSNGGSSRGGGGHRR